jgi:hypothetical protein
VIVNRNMNGNVHGKTRSSTHERNHLSRKEGGRNMDRIHRRIEIKALVHKIFAFLNNSKSEPDRLPSMVEVKDLPRSAVGTHFKWWGDDRWDPI